MLTEKSIFGRAYNFSYETKVIFKVKESIKKLGKQTLVIFNIE